MWSALWSLKNLYVSTLSGVEGRSSCCTKCLIFRWYCMHLRIEFNSGCVDGIMNAMVKLVNPWSALCFSDVLKTKRTKQELVLRFVVSGEIIKFSPLYIMFASTIVSLKCSWSKYVKVNKTITKEQIYIIRM